MPSEVYGSGALSHPGRGWTPTFPGLTGSQRWVLPHWGVSACAPGRVALVGTSWQCAPTVLMQLPGPLLTPVSAIATLPLALGAGWGTAWMQLRQEETRAAVAAGQWHRARLDVVDARAWSVLCLCQCSFGLKLGGGKQFGGGAPSPGAGFWWLPEPKQGWGQLVGAQLCQPARVLPQSVTGDRQI